MFKQSEVIKITDAYELATHLRNLEAYIKAKKVLCKQLEALHEESTVAAYIKRNKLKLTKEV